MKIAVDYLPESKNNGPIIKSGPTRLVPEPAAEPHPDPGVMMPNTNIARTRSKVKLALRVSALAFVFAVGFFIMAAFWLWHIEDRETDQAELLDAVQKTVLRQQVDIERLHKLISTGLHLDEDRETDPCKLPLQVGACKKTLVRWYYDGENGDCKEFFFSGCDGNANNFDTKDDCVERCQPKQIESDACKMKADSGPCRSIMPKFYFDAESNKCAEFSYGGCAGNGNRFDTEKECRERCLKEPTAKEICQLPSKVGHCRGAIPKFFHNPATGKCELFLWGGCGGNGNKFEKEEECAKFCA